MIRLIASDMDGTLLDDNKQMNSEMIGLVKALKKLGIYFCAASGRQLKSVRGYFSEIDDDVIYIAENGAHVFYQGKQLFVDNMGEETANAVVEHIKKCGDYLIILSTARGAFSDDERTIKMMRKDIFNYDISFVEDLHSVAKEAVKITIVGEKTEGCTEPQELPSTLAEKVYTAESGFNCLDFMEKGISKGSAMKIVHDQLGISKEETVVFGDNFNDLDMFDEAYYSYAMQNAVDEVKARARFVAGNNNDNGVVKTILELLRSKKVDI